MNYSRFLPLVLLVVSCSHGAEEARFPVPTPVSLIALDEGQFVPFAQAVMREVEVQLSQETPSAPIMQLRAIQVHVSLHLAQTEAALLAAQRIQAQLPAGPIHDYAGLTSRALVAAQQATGNQSGNAEFNVVFAATFSKLLATLPQTPDMRNLLAQQKVKYDAMTEAAVRGEIAAFEESLGSRDHCTLAEADQLVRWRHRLVDLVPLRDEIRACLAAAIALRR